ncbi:hypothetical protein GGS24DRAFT_331790 [Hypoxylon argillaceum]|nr:hypothetical protein GGS24DRAFT_331790 [Hypoxylon argillaceum]KAI1149745.1 hypothetical protein F4825DRAFT_37542 [Nemania diffusa]
MTIITAVEYKTQLMKHCSEAASTIHAECAEILAAKDQYDQVTIIETSVAGCGTALVELLSRQANIVHGLYENHLQTNTGAPEISSTQKDNLALKRLEDIASIAYSKFYAYLFKDLPVYWRQLYTDARILKFCLLLLRSPYAAVQHEPDRATFENAVAGVHRHDCLDELVKTLDLALILAGAAGEQRGRRWIDKALELLHFIWVAESKGQDVDNSSAARHTRPAKRAKLSGDHEASNMDDAHLTSATFSTHEPFTPPVTHPIRKTEALSIDEFQTYMDRPRDPKLGPEPLIIRGTLSEWPALSTRPWNRPSYLLSQTFGGRRLVPVEIGRSYVDEGWGQKLLTFGEFLHTYIDPTSVHSTTNPPPTHTNPAPHNTTLPLNPTAYLAQHQLFTQLPSLRADILIPDYCYTAPPPHPLSPTLAQPELAAPLLNAWLGPPGTISPLHTDPYHNVLAQAVGRKYVRLYAPRETPRLAARGRERGVEMGNTSRVDVGVLEGWDAGKNGGSEEGGEAMSEEEIEAFKAIPFVDCILEPGDALYIPIGWWHYVRGLSVSFSVSFWWN